MLKLFRHPENAAASGSGCTLAVFEEFLLPHADLIGNAACRLTGNKEDAADLTQETFYYALRNFHQVKDRGKCKYWLFSILRNLFLKEVLKSKRRGELAAEYAGFSMGDGDGVEGELLRAEEEKLVREVLEKLDKRLRRTIELFYFHKMSYKEIAGCLDLPIGTVMSRIARAKLYLRKEWHLMMGA